jgi:hypothetical protein
MAAGHQALSLAHTRGRSPQAAGTACGEVYYVVELVGIEPTPGQPVTARPGSPWITPQRNTKGQRPLGAIGCWPFVFIDIIYIKFDILLQAYFNLIYIFFVVAWK